MAGNHHRSEWMDQALKPSQAGFEAMLRGAEPAMKSLMHWNTELMQLASRRGQAWMDIPRALTACKSPQDVAGAQMQFWQSAMRDYVETSQRMMSIWTGAFAATAHGLERAERDYITFPEPKEAPRPHDRRAA